MQRRIFVLPFLTVALLLLLSGCGKPKTYYSIITGKIASLSGRPVYSASIAVQTSSGVLSAFSNQDGAYTITVPSGQVTLAVSKAGYVSCSETLKLENNQRLNKDVQLAVVTPSVTIEGDVTIGN